MHSCAPPSSVNFKLLEGLRAVHWSWRTVLFPLAGEPVCDNYVLLCRNGLPREKNCQAGLVNCQWRLMQNVWLIVFLEDTVAMRYEKPMKKSAVYLPFLCPAKELNCLPFSFLFGVHCAEGNNWSERAKNNVFNGATTGVGWHASAIATRRLLGWYALCYRVFNALVQMQSYQCLHTGPHTLGRADKETLTHTELFLLTPLHFWCVIIFGSYYGWTMLETCTMWSSWTTKIIREEKKNKQTNQNSTNSIALFRAMRCYTVNTLTLSYSLAFHSLLFFKDIQKFWSIQNRIPDIT